MWFALGKIILIIAYLRNEASLPDNPWDFSPVRCGVVRLRESGHIIAVDNYHLAETRVGNVHDKLIVFLLSQAAKDHRSTVLETDRSEPPKRGVIYTRVDVLNDVCMLQTCVSSQSWHERCQVCSPNPCTCDTKVIPGSIL